jgi:4-hydroxy-tetrahydrodipicolinate synthase
VTAHVWGDQIKQMIRRYAEGDVDGARALHEELRPSYDLLKVTTNPIAIKTALNLLGHDLGGFRLPMVEASEDEAAQIRACLERGRVLARA